MLYLMVDISGRSTVYDIHLCEALHRVLHPEYHLKLLTPSINPKDIDFDCGKLFNILPHRLQNSNRIPFRAIKALMVIMNYIGLIARIALRKPHILHLQWLPLTEVSSIEKSDFDVIYECPDLPCPKTLEECRVLRDFIKNETFLFFRGLNY